MEIETVNSNGYEDGRFFYFPGTFYFFNLCFMEVSTLSWKFLRRNKRDLLYEYTYSYTINADRID